MGSADDPDGTEPTLHAEPTSADAENQPRAGDRVDHYVLHETLGAGGMGVVFRASDTRLGRDVAIKLLRTSAEVGSDACRALCQRLMREAQAMAKLSHPNLVPVYDVGTHGGRVFIVMELIEGTTLRSWANEKHSWSDRLDTLIAAGGGLAEAHDAGVLHRDFKPENVLIGHNGRVKVADFGLARGVSGDEDVEPVAHCDTSDASTSVRLTKTGAAVGTPIYMSPEQHEGTAIDARSDQFNFAASAYEVLYDQAPFPGRSIAQLASAVREGDLRPVPTDTAVPKAILTVLQRAMQPGPDARFSSMHELLSALEQARKQRGLFSALGRALRRTPN